jgi:hypothetical protein
MALVEEKRTRTLLFVVDTSSGMSVNSTGLDKVNSAINDVAQDIRDKSLKRGDVQFKINVLGFSGKTARWLNPKPVDINGFSCNLAAEYNKQDVDANFSVACNELIEKISDPAFMGGPANAFPPVIIIVANYKFDDKDKETLDKLMGEKALKLLIVAGGEIDVNELTELKRNRDMEILGPKYSFDDIYENIREKTVKAAWLCAETDLWGKAY